MYDVFSGAKKQQWMLYFYFLKAKGHFSYLIVYLIYKSSFPLETFNLIFY